MALGGCASAPSEQLEERQDSLACTGCNDEYPYELNGFTKLVLDERFDGPLDPALWVVQENGNGNGNAEVQYYQPQNVEVADGLLKISGKKESRTDFAGRVPHEYTSGKITTKGKFAIQNGKIAVRAKSPEGAGTWGAAWLLAVDSRTKGWPGCGEIDIMETGERGAFDSVVAGNFHTAEAENGLWRHSPFHYSPPGFSTWDGFHIYEVEWTPQSMAFYVDGNRTGQIDKNEDNQYEFSNYYYVIVNLALMSQYTEFGGFQPYDLDAILPQELQVDWIKVWQKPSQGEVIRNYGTSGSVTKPSGGNYLIMSENTPGAYRYAYTEGENLQFWTPSLTTNNAAMLQPGEEPPYLGPKFKPGAYEGSQFIDYVINSIGWGWTGQGWYSEFPLDLTDYQNGFLSLAVKTSSPITLNAGMVTTSGEVKIELNEAFGFENDGEWHQVRVPMSLIASQVDLSQVIYPLILITNEPAAGEQFRVGLDNVYLEWQPDEAVIYLDPTDNSLVFVSQFDEQKKNLWLNLRVNGSEVHKRFVIPNAKELHSGSGQYVYFWDSGLAYNPGDSLEAQIIGKGTSTDYFPETYSAPFVIGSSERELDYQKVVFNRNKFDMTPYPNAVSLRQ